MSLILYGDDNDEERQEFRVILENRNTRTLVLQNTNTNELSLVNNHKHSPNYRSSESEIYSVRCPNCGAFTLNTQRDSVDQETQNEDVNSFMDSNYFKLLEESSSDTISRTYEEHLPSAIFTQGYFDKFFREIELLGRGSRGSVYKVEHVLNNVPLGEFALKKITIGNDPKWLMKVLHEVTMLVKLSSNTTNLVSYNHVWLEVDSINSFGPKVPCAFILQQYCSGGNLEDFINVLKEPKLTVKQMKEYKIRRIQGRLLNNEEVLIIFIQIVNGVLELHKNHIIHRDLKPSNCLLSSSYLQIPNLDPDIENIPSILISDFGESQLEGSKRTASGNTGTLEYCAPEVLFEMKEFSQKTDIYSLGMILHFICFGKLPIQSNTLNELKFEIDSMRTQIIHERKDLHEGFTDLIKNLISKDSSSRMDTLEILNKLNEISTDLKTLNKPRKLSIDDLHDNISDSLREESLKYSNKNIFFIKTSKGIVISYLEIMLFIAQTVLLVAIVKNKETIDILKYLLIFINGTSINSSFNQNTRYILLFIMTLINISLYIYIY